MIEAVRFVPLGFNLVLSPLMEAFIYYVWNISAFATLKTLTNE